MARPVPNNTALPGYGIALAGFISRKFAEIRLASNPFTAPSKFALPSKYPPGFKKFADRMFASNAAICKKLGVTEQTYYR